MNWAYSASSDLPLRESPRPSIAKPGSPASLKQPTHLRWPALRLPIRDELAVHMSPAWGEGDPRLADQGSRQLRSCRLVQLLEQVVECGVLDLRQDPSI
jgi:hypothetical protein